MYNIPNNYLKFLLNTDYDKIQIFVTGMSCLAVNYVI